MTHSTVHTKKPMLIEHLYLSLPKELRYNYDAKTKALHDRSREVRCVGYAFNGHKLNQAENPVTYVKDSYIIYLPDQDAIRVRHDCYFQSYTDQDGKDFQIGG